MTGDRPARSRARKDSGSIRPHTRGTEPTGQWMARVSLGADPMTGKRRTLAKVLPTRKAADQWVKQQLALKSEGRLSARMARDTVPTLEQWAAEFYGQHRIGRHGRELSPRTIESDQEALRLWVATRAPAIWKTPLDRLTAPVLQQLFRGMVGTYARDTIARVYRVLRARLADAVDRGYLSRSPFLMPSGRAAIVIPADAHVPERREWILSPAQAEAFAGAAEGTKHGALWQLLLFTGLRSGEAAALTWDDVDLERGRLFVRRALVRTKARGAELRSPKTKRSTRQLELKPAAVRVLRAHRIAQAEHRLKAGAEYRDRGLVFATTFGDPINVGQLAAHHLGDILAEAAARLTGQSLPELPPSSRSERFKVALKAWKAAAAAAKAAAGLHPISPHNLRHTYATLELARGRPDTTVAQELGHAQLSTTKDVYVGMLQEVDLADLPRWERLLGVSAPTGADSVSLRTMRG
jgi:integrase